MSVIVTDRGFAPDAWAQGFVPLAAAGAATRALDLAHTDDPALAVPLFPQLALIRVNFPAFNDGRGLTVGRRLRLAGYAGRLRAAGPLIADQYAMLRRTGFDEVEIPDDIADRQPWPQWQARADWRAHDYLARLRG